jgi:predicted RecA/RadA family phage recombinase
MKNYKSEGKTLRYTAGADISAGDPVQVGGLAGVAMSDIANGDTDELAMKGVFSFAKDGNAYSQGDLVEWSNGGAQVVPDASGDYDLGYVWKAADAGDSEVEVRLL